MRFFTLLAVGKIIGLRICNHLCGKEEVVGPRTHHKVHTIKSKFVLGTTPLRLCGICATVLGSGLDPLSSLISCTGHWGFWQAGWVCVWPLDSQQDFFAYVGNSYLLTLRFIKRCWTARQTYPLIRFY